MKRKFAETKAEAIVRILKEHGFKRDFSTESNLSAVFTKPHFCVCVYLDCTNYTTKVFSVHTQIL